MRALRPTASALGPSDVVRFIDSIGRHDIRVLAGIEAATLIESLALDAPVRPVVWLDCPDASASRIVESALAQLAGTLRGLWPYPWGGEDFADLRDDPLGRAHLPIRLAGLAERHPGVSPTWAEKMVRRLVQGRAPRLPDPVPALEWAQLALAVSPVGLVVATTLSRGEGTAERVRAFEWLAHHAEVALLVLTEGFAEVSHLDHLSFGARRFVRPLDAPADPAQPSSPEPRPALVLPRAPEGRPHPMSPTERRLHALIQADEELRPLFQFNQTIPGLRALYARADLVWLEGRVAVEIDGHEHRAAAKFCADRHRDYELMCAGYRVLRMTNEEVAIDAALAIEKIRTVARLARTEA